MLDRNWNLNIGNFTVISANACVLYAIYVICSASLCEIYLLPGPSEVQGVVCLILYSFVRPIFAF